MKTYVYDGEEVYATGRTAAPKMQKHTKRLSTAPIMIEIKPIDTTNGAWVKWVQETELYEIVDNSTE